MELMVNGWNVMIVNNCDTGGTECEDTLDNNIELLHIESDGQ